MSVQCVPSFYRRPHRTGGEVSLDRIAQDAVRRRRRKLLISVLEVALGDLVAMDGVQATRKVIARFYDQLDL